MSERSIRRLMTAIQTEFDDVIPEYYFHYGDLIGLLYNAIYITNKLVGSYDITELYNQYKLRRLLHNDHQLSLAVGSFMEHYKMCDTAMIPSRQLSIQHIPLELIARMSHDVDSKELMRNDLMGTNNVKCLYNAVNTLCRHFAKTMLPENAFMSTLRLYYEPDKSKDLTLWFEASDGDYPSRNDPIMVWHNIQVPLTIFRHTKKDMRYTDTDYTKHTILYVNTHLIKRDRISKEREEPDVLRNIKMEIMDVAEKVPAPVEIQEWP